MDVSAIKKRGIFLGGIAAAAWCAAASAEEVPNPAGAPAAPASPPAAGAPKEVPAPVEPASQPPPATPPAGTPAASPWVGLEASPMDALFPASRVKHSAMVVAVERLAPKDEDLGLVYPDGAMRWGVSGGPVLSRQWMPTGGIGFARLDGLAVGAHTSAVSEEETNLWLVPLELGLTYVFDYDWNQILMPYLGVGADGWVWREKSPEAVTTGVKWGAHASGGLLIRLNFMETTTGWSRSSTAPVDVALQVGVTAAWVDSFGQPGLDFSAVRFGLGGMLAF